MPTSINIQEFINLSKSHPILDVRTPAEFAKGHIPGAFNLPLFTDDERVIIGTIYKQEGKQPAISKGLEFVGPRLHEFIAEAGKIANTGTLLLHCWRGGMRSGSMAWLFETYGFKSITLKGGYKSFRHHVIDSFDEPKKLLVIGGRTGSGKTLILHELKNQGEQIVDLEQIANHKGSSYGSLGEEKQLSQEQFENELSTRFALIDKEKNCWVEDESRKIGHNVLPDGFYLQLRNSPVAYVDLSMEARLNYLVKEYGKFKKEDLIAATQRIAKRLGGQHVKRALEAIEEGDLRTACEISLVYYDKTYEYGVSLRDQEKVIRFPFDELDVTGIAKKIKTI